MNLEDLFEHVELVDVVWILINTTTLIFAILGLYEAKKDQEAVKLLNGKAREIASSGVVRREWFRVTAQIFLLLVAIPSLFTEGPQFLTPRVAILMFLPILLLASSLMDARERRTLGMMVAADIINERTSSLERIELALAENTAISQGARDDAHVAVEVANTVNEKIIHLNEALLKQGEDRQAELEAQTEVVETIDDTHAKVMDLHDQIELSGK